MIVSQERHSYHNFSRIETNRCCSCLLHSSTGTMELKKRWLVTSPWETARPFLSKVGKKRFIELPTLSKVHFAAMPVKLKNVGKSKSPKLLEVNLETFKHCPAFARLRLKFLNSRRIHWNCCWPPQQICGGLKVLCLYDTVFLIHI